MKNDSSVLSHPAASHTSKYCIQTLETSSSIGGMTTVLHILTLLKEIIGTFPKGQTKVQILENFHLKIFEKSLHFNFLFFYRPAVKPF